LFVEDPIGTVANPMSQQEQDAKFMELTVDVLGADRAQPLRLPIGTGRFMLAPVRR